MTLQNSFVYGLLTLALISLWLPKKTDLFSIRIWYIFCAAAIGGGLLFGYLQLSGVVSIFILGISCYLAGSEQQIKPVRIIAGCLMFVLSVGLTMHIIPGFSNPKVIEGVVISEGGIPYSKYLNFDKTVVGLFIIGLTFNNLLSTLRDCLDMIKKIIFPTCITILVILIISYAFGYVRFDPKWSSLFWFWIWTNLFFTCIAEEAVFRGIIQRYIIEGLKKYRYGAKAGLVIAAVLFGAAHYSGGLKYVILATVAGICYGAVYLRTGQVEASILTHLIFNTTHFIFFTYPALASAM
ncbi:MAG: CPBP family intramembrane metalloprotease [Deltaproteobacteria bacterium]|nr:CPBP family intramembrane metalloprotease [Deltaproteobacteria bacterium]